MDEPIASKCFELAIKYHANQMRDHIEPQINHIRRVGQRAILAEWSDFLVGACYLHDVLDMNRDIYYDIGQEIKAIDQDLFRIVDKIAKRDNESWKAYYHRIILVPEAKKILWLDHIDILPDVDQETRERILQYLPQLVP